MTLSRFEQERRAASRRRDAEVERLKKERDELLAREKVARAEAETAQRRLSELSSMSRTFASSMRGVSVERQRARRRLAVQHAVGCVLAEADGLEDAAARILEVVGGGFGWDLGALWTVDEGADVLRCYEVWRASETPSSGETNGHQNGFESASRRESLPRGSGLPGRVWGRGEALWIEDVLEDEGFLRREAAAGEGLRKAFAFPIRDGGRTRGVIEFFGREVAPPDEDLLRAAALIGGQIGQFAERRRAERERDRLLARERAARAEADAARREVTGILESINDAFVAFDHDWRYTYINGAARELVSASGRDLENLLGKVLWEESPELAGTGYQTGLLRAAREGETVEFEEFYPPLGAWFQVRAYPSEGGVSVYFEDVTERKEAEEALRRNEARWRALIDKGADVITISDREGIIRFASPSIEKISGYTVEEFVGTDPFEAGHIHPDDMEHCEEAFRELADNPGGSVNIQHRYRHKSGGWRWLEGTFTSLFHDPAIGGLVANFRDITERKEAEERLAESEERFRAAFEQARVGIVQASLDGRVLVPNPGFCQIIGYTEEEAREMHVRDFTHPDDYEADIKQGRRVVTGEIPGYSMEKRYVRKDGSVIWVNITSTVARGDDGEPLYALAIVEDIDERKRADEALRESEARFRHVFSNNMVAMAVWAKTGEITDANDAMLDLIGYTREELEAGSLDWMELTPSEYRTRDEEAIVEVEAHGVCTPYEKEFVRKGGCRVPIVIGGGRVDERTGTGILFAVDLTERKQAEEALRESEEQLRTVAEGAPVVLFSLDKDGVYTLLEGRGLEALGLRPGELVGRSIYEVYSDHPGIRQHARRALSGETFIGEDELGERFFETWYAPVRGEDGEVAGVIGVATDATERKRAEAERDRFFELSPDLLCITDLDGCFRRVNPAYEEVLGYTEEEILARPFIELVHPEDREKTLAELEKERQGITTLQLENRVLRKDGAQRCMLWTIIPVLEEGTLYKAGRDITELKKAEEERERSLAHEWTLRAQTEERRRISRELHDRVAHSMGVVHQSLELHEVFKERKPSQAEAKMKLAKETTREALDLTRNISRELHNTEASDGLSAALSNLLKTAVPPGLESSVSVQGDETLIPHRVREQLFLILREAVRNTVSHSGAGRLGIEVKVSPERAVGTVEDDGRGFEEAYEGNGGAPGSGLRSMRERAELVGGALKLSSAPGAGTKIETSVPLNAN